MKIEKLDNNKSKIKIAFLCGFIIAVVLIILINIFIAKASYRKTENIPLAKGTINYTLVDFEIVEIKIDGKPSNKMPVGNYELTNESYCTEKDDQFQDITNKEIKLTYQNNILSVSNYTKKGTKCHLVFKKKLSPSEDTLATLELKSQGPVEKITGPSCNKSSTTCGGSDSTVGTNMKQVGVYAAEDNDGTSYYFRGAVTNNWVKFGTNDDGVPVWWRIVRINGDGTIRLIYAGTGTTAPKPTGDQTLVATDQTYSAGGADIDNTYVGFYYGSKGATDFSATHSNKAASNVANELKKWYEGENWKDTYNKYIDEDAGFCNDRTKPYKGTHGSEHTQEGYGNKPTVYGPVHRVYQTGSTSYNMTEQTPTLKCGQLDLETEVNETDYKRDLYTPKNAKKGNGKLEVPVGLITSDEVIFAGGFAGKTNDGYYLYNYQYFWTMSPHFMSSNGRALVFTVDYYGNLGYNYVSSVSGVRPVINLKTDAPIKTESDSNKGTTDNPYIVG